VRRNLRNRAAQVSQESMPNPSIVGLPNPSIVTLPNPSIVAFVSSEISAFIHTDRQTDMSTSTG